MIYKMIKLFLFTGLLLISGSSCEKDGEQESCNNPVPETDVKFLITARILYSDSTAFSGTVDFNIYRLKCDGYIEGDFKITKEANEFGIFNPATLYTFRYSDEEDQVKVHFTIHNESSSAETHFFYDEYPYFKVKDIPGLQVTKEYLIVLPWP